MRRLAIRVMLSSWRCAGSAQRAAPARDLILVTDARGSRRPGHRGHWRAGQLRQARRRGRRGVGTAEQSALARPRALEFRILTPEHHRVYAQLTRGPSTASISPTPSSATRWRPSPRTTPGICRLETLGTSYNGNLLLAMKVSDNPGIHENEPAVHFEGGIHGDEKIGWAVAFEMLKYLVSNYSTDTLVTRLVDTRELWLLSDVQPGRVHRRLPLQRRLGGPEPQLGLDVGLGIQHGRRAVLRAGEPGRARPHPAPPFRDVRVVPRRHRVRVLPVELQTRTPLRKSRCLNFLSQRYIVPNGYEYGQGYSGMYAINGSTKDYDYGQGMMGWSIEVHYSKTPPADSIQPTFDRNRPAITRVLPPRRAGHQRHGHRRRERPAGARPGLGQPGRLAELQRRDARRLPPILPARDVRQSRSARPATGTRRWPVSLSRTPATLRSRSTCR